MSIKSKTIKNKELRVRLAPSPTGNLHMGTARAALFNFLFARKYNGKFILRIEDTDAERSEEEFEKSIMDGLEWLGLEWDEGPIKDDRTKYRGQYGPYRQSQRKEIYKKYINKLLEEKKAYFCFCSKEDLENQRQYLMSIGQPARYSGKCRDLPIEVIEQYLKEKKPYVIRIKTPFKKVAFNDLIRGKVEFDSELIGDIVIAKDEESPLYNLAAVIDDYEMEITHVIRGEDHISNTPKQILMQEILEFPHPEYAHLPLILGPDRSKLSKRHGAVSVFQYKKEGYLPEALINFMAFLGWNPGIEREIYSLPSLIKDFSLEECQKAGAVFNMKRLDWINGFYIRQKPLESLVNLCIPYFKEANFIEESENNNKNGKNLKNSVHPKELKLFNDKKIKFIIKETNEIATFDWIKMVIAAYQERLKKLSEITELTDFFFKDNLEYDKNILKWKDMSNQELTDSLETSERVLIKIDNENFTKENLEKILLEEAEKTDPSATLDEAMRAGDRGRLLWPLRVALSGKKASASPFEIAEILGKEKTLKRIKEAIKNLK